MERDLQSLLDMLQSARIIVNYISGRSKEELTTDLQFQDAMIRRLLIIGEASKRVSETTRQILAQIPWVAINGMRNRLVHEYDEIDLDIIWDTAVKSLPLLILELEKVVPSDKS
ncbi:MAG: HepT-like ribonuclease domain-containing protein [Kovacikia sp.]